MRERYEYYKLEQGHGVLVSDLILEGDVQLDEEAETRGNGQLPI